MKNKLTDNDPRLTAYALGELSRDEADEVSRMLDAPLNGPLKREVQSIDALGVILTQTLDKGNSEDLKLKLSPGQRDAIFRSSKAPTVEDVESTHQSAWLRPVIVTLGAAALVTMSFIALYHVDSDEDKIAGFPEVSYSGLSDDEMHAPIQVSNADWEGVSDVSSQGAVQLDHTHTSHSNGVSIGEEPDSLIKLVENDWVNRADQAVTRMPLVCGKASWSWMKQSIEVDGILPDKNAVRVEEIINAFSYDKPSDLELSFTTSGVELVQCPWNAERMIAIILVKNKHVDSAQVEAAVTFSESVEKYRLVGYAKGEDLEDNVMAPAKIIMGAGDSHLVMYEIETVAGIEVAADVLSLNIRSEVMSEGERVREGKTLKVQFSDRAWTKSVKDVQFALILATWSQILSESNYDAGMNKEGLVEMIHGFESAHTIKDEQAQALEIIKKSLNLIGL